MIETYVPNSSNLDRVDYDSETREMTVTFKDYSTYVYSGVPVEKFLGLQNARSAGEYFYRQIRDVYPYEEG